VSRLLPEDGYRIQSPELCVLNKKVIGEPWFPGLTLKTHMYSADKFLMF
jgi:hypothetical protein